MKLTINSPHATGYGTTITDEHGNDLAKDCFDVSISINPHDANKVVLKYYLKELRFEGEAQVERVTVCPSCKKELDRQFAEDIIQVRPVDSTPITSDYLEFIPGPNL